METSSKFIKFIIGLPLSFLALFFIYKLFANQKNILQPLTHVNPFLLVLSILGFLSYFFLRSLFWQKLLSINGIKLSFKESSLIWGMSELKRYVPGNVWSFISRTMKYHEKGHDKKIVIKSLFQEIGAIILASIIVSLFSLNFLIFAFLPSFPLKIFTPSLIVITVGTFVFLLIFNNKFIPKKLKFVSSFLPSQNPGIILQLIATMSFAFLFFGLATFFSISSIFNLYLPHVLPLSGFFTFSLLIGYLSFITPMGLGVREAINTAGLAKYIPLSEAALSSIFSRLVFIVSELIFLGICLIWTKINSEYLKKIEKFVLSHKYQIAMLFFVGFYILYFTLTSFLRYNNFYTGRFDLGNMDQTVWNTVHGRFFQLTNPDGTSIMSRLAFHADFMLALLAPLYWIWQDPRMLLLIQSVALGIGGLFIFLISQKVLKNNFLSFAFSLSFLIYPGVDHANIFDFHAVTLAVPLLLAAWYFLQKNKFFLSTILLILAGTTKEEIWLIVGLFGLWMFFVKNQKILGFFLSIFSFWFFYFLFWHAIPGARGSESFAVSYYSDFGANPTQIIKNLFLSPVKLLETIFGNGRPLYLLEVFAPTLFISFFAPIFLIFTIPDLGLSLLSQNAQLHSIHYHYAAILSPFVFISSIYGLKFILKKYKFISQKFMGNLLLISGILCAYFYGPLPGAISFNHDMYTHPLAHASQIDSFLQSIPRRYSVAATNNVGSHLSHRQLIYTIPNGVDKADIVVMLLNDQFAQPSLKVQKDLAKKLEHDPNYTVLISINDFIVFKRIEIPTKIRNQRNFFFLFINKNLL